MKNLIKRLLRENILNEISLGDAWTKIYSDTTKFPALQGNQELFLQLNDLYPKNGDNFNKGLFNWLYKLLKNNQLKTEDFYKVKEYLKLYTKFINKVPVEQRDINKVNTLGDLYNIIEPFTGEGENQDVSKSQQLKRVKNDEIKKVYEDDEWKVMIPLTQEASCLIGKGTQWCTAADRSNNKFDRYNKQGPLYVCIDLFNDTKYQIHFETEELMDERDNSVDSVYFFDHVANRGLTDFLRQSTETFYAFIITTGLDNMLDEYSYSELYFEALENCPDASAVRNALEAFRKASYCEPIANGFFYEKDPDNITSRHISNLLAHADEFEESSTFDNIMKHLVDIKYDFEDSDNNIIRVYRDALLLLKQHKLETGKGYTIDKGRTLTIDSIDYTKEVPMFNVTMSKGGKSSSGIVPMDRLLSYIHNRSLFESKNLIKSLLREQLIMEQRLKHPMDIPQDILGIQAIFKQNNHKLYVVGGAVRDALLGKTPKDFDLATDAVPDKVESMMKQAGLRTLPTGKAFGVINVFTDAGEYEIATFRADVGTGRRPDSVNFTDINTDCQRRDLTMNALYYDIEAEEIIDLVGGIADLKAGIVNTVGNPEDRFKEDPLRILRYFRMLARI